MNNISNWLKIGTCGVIVTVALTGCGSSNNVSTPLMNGNNLDTKVLKTMYKDLSISDQELKNGQYILVASKGEYSMLSMKKQNNHILSGIQKAAQDTLDTGNKYFSIIKPNKLASLNITTLKEYKDNCLSNNPFGGGDACDVSNDNLLRFTLVGHYLEEAGAKMLIKTYKTKPDNIKVLDAQEILDQLKQNKELQKDIAVSK